MPLSYYHPTGPAGDVFDHLRARRASAVVAVIGLGAGSLCAYALPGDEWVFYELDPAVETTPERVSISGLVLNYHLLASV